MTLHLPFFFFFFFNDTATTEIYPLSLHDALPIYHPPARVLRSLPNTPSGGPNITGVLPGGGRGTGHTSDNDGPVSLDRQAQHRREYPNGERVSDLRTPVSKIRHTDKYTKSVEKTSPD